MEPRLPAVAGIFYPDRKESLAELVDHLVPSVRRKQKAVAAVVPHGSLFSSGAVAGAVYGRLIPFSTVVILGPNHSCIGERLSLAADGEWVTPLGRVPVDTELSRAIRKAVPGLKKDSEAHRYEHAAEVQLPFLQRLWKIRSFVPLAIGGVDLETARQVGLGLAQALRRTGRDALLIASNNLSRYEPRERAEPMDRQMTGRILELDGQGLMEEVARSGASTCGAPAVAAMLAASKELGASRASLVKYEVGYAGILVD